MQENALAIVPIRGGSKGLPGKNLRQIAGKPLYQHAVEQGIRLTGRCLLTTDIPEVLAKRHDPRCVVLKRPLELSDDSASMDQVLCHALNSDYVVGQNPIHLVLLQATSPLRDDNDIRAAIELHSSGRFGLVMSVTEADRGILKSGLLKGDSFTPIARPEYCFANRQELPSVYKPNGAIYVFSPKLLDTGHGLASDNIGAIQMPRDRSFDIDTEGDFMAVKQLMERDGLAGTRA